MRESDEMTNRSGQLPVVELAISAVVCTHNRAALLPQALESLAAQTLEREQYEIIVVNNASTDETSDVVTRWKEKWPSIRLLLVDEPLIGLGHARNRGWACARGRYVAFMDDDAKAHSGWLQRAVELIQGDGPTPVAVGGQILPFYPSPKPAWYKDEYEVRSWGQVPRRLNPGESFSGSNMLIARDVLQRLGGFDVSVGMQGERMSMGEETVLFQKMWNSLGDQAVFLYSPNLVVYHAVGRQKMRPSYQLLRSFVAGQVACRLDAPLSWRERWRRVRWNMTAIRKLTVAAFEQRGRFSDRRAWIVEQGGPVALEFGRLLAGMGLSVPVRRGKLS